MRAHLNVRKSFAAVATATLVAVPLSACSSDDGSATEASGSGSSQSQQAPEAPPQPVASIPALTGENTQVTLDKGFVAALQKLKLTPGPTGDATLEGGDTLVFPITGGNVTVFKPGEVSPYVIGQIQHEFSGLQLSAGGTKVEIANLNVDPGASRVYGDVFANGKLVVSSAPVFNLDGRTLQPLESQGDTAVLEGSKVMISSAAADLLNKTFKTQAIKEGLLVGTAKITVSTK